MNVPDIVSLNILAFTIVSITCTQNLYKFIPEHCEVININKSLIDIETAKCYKVNREELYLNVTFRPLVDIRNDRMGQIKIIGYQFRSNEYRKGPIEFMLGLCSATVSKQFDIPHMLSNSNFKCPLKKGVIYYIYKLSPNATNMPPLIPEGRWKLQLDFLYLNKFVIGSLAWYSGVEYHVFKARFESNKVSPNLKIQKIMKLWE